MQRREASSESDDWLIMAFSFSWFTINWLLSVFGYTFIFDRSSPIQTESKIIDIAFRVNIAFHIAWNIFKLFLNGFHIGRHLERQQGRCRPEDPVPHPCAGCRQRKQCAHHDPRGRYRQFGYGAKNFDTLARAIEVIFVSSCWCVKYFLLIEKVYLSEIFDWSRFKLYWCVLSFVKERDSWHGKHERTC